MTKAQFNSKFNCVAGPEHSGAEYPPFDEHAINERNFPHGLRYKEYNVDFNEGVDGSPDRIEVDWKSQSWDDIEPLFNEVKRCFKACGFAGHVKLHVYGRDGEHDELLEEDI